MRLRSCRMFCALILVVCSTAMAENWPGWRGPRGDGTSVEKNVPTEWSSTKNVIWKTPLKGKGHASPIVWGDRVYLVSAENQERVLRAFDASSGKPLWRTTVLVSPKERIHRLNSFASSTPVTDGKRIYVSFLDQKKMFVAAYDLDGKKIWEARPGVFSSKHGYCSSPLIWKDTLIVNGDHDGPGYLVAMDLSTGKTRWKIDRPNNTRSYCAPLIRTIDGRDQMILTGSKCVASYDPGNGKLHWIIDGPTEQFVASPVYNGKLIFMTAGFPALHMMAIRPDGKGNVTKTHIAWRTQKNSSYVPSPIAAGPYFMVTADKGVGSCFEAASGKRLWQERLGSGPHSASLVSAGGVIYFTSDSGVTTVVKPGATLDKIAVNDLGEKCSASPAISGGRIFIRTFEHLYCIGSGSR